MELSDEYLRAHTVGELKPLSGPILVVDYDSEWPRRFEQEAAKIASALGARALRVEHVGSTSVPGLAAKPVIDIALAVADSTAESEYLPALEGAGYRLGIREPEWHEHRLFQTAEADVNLHVFSAGCPEIERMLSFLIGRERIQAIAICTPGRSGRWRRRNGSIRRITRMPRLR